MAENPPGVEKLISIISQIEFVRGQIENNHPEHKTPRVVNTIIKMVNEGRLKDAGLTYRWEADKFQYYDRPLKELLDRLFATDYP